MCHVRIAPPFVVDLENSPPPAPLVCEVDAAGAPVANLTVPTDGDAGYRADPWATIGGEARCDAACAAALFGGGGGGGGGAAVEAR